jgi:anthranilate/para-aminobenzoate synthase component II
VVDESTLPAEFVVTARSADGEVMGLRHRRWPLEGVQFHPESYRTPEGIGLLRNFVGAR